MSRVCPKPGETHSCCVHTLSVHIMPTSVCVCVCVQLHFVDRVSVNGHLRHFQLVTTIINVVIKVLLHLACRMGAFTAVKRRYIPPRKWNNPKEYGVLSGCGDGFFRHSGYPALYAAQLRPTLCVGLSCFMSSYYS